METGRHNFRGTKPAPQLIQKWEQSGARFYFYCPDTILELTVVSVQILRFRYAPESRLEDGFSYAVLENEKLPVVNRGQFELVEKGDEFLLRTPFLICKISKSLHISIFDMEGNLISEDERGFHWDPHHEYGGNQVYCNKKIQEQEIFYGLGDKPERLNLRGLRFENWGFDAYGFERTSDPLYKNIPFYFGLHHDLAYGIFFDNTFRTRFDFGYERSDICTFWSEGGEMDYYFIYGPTLLEVAEHYTLLTGKPELPPLWALGYHQSRWSYHPESKVREVAAELRAHQIPCDVIHLDIDYMDGYRCFTWDKEKFPDPLRMITELETDGFKFVAIIDPGIKIDKNYFVCQEGVENGFFCRRADGPLMNGNVWPGPCYFPDFTNPKVREWWSGLFEEFMKTGIQGIWNDMNEPAIMDRKTFPLDTRHHFDGHPCSHRKAHNVYGMQMARASYDGVKKTTYPRRPFMISRSGYAGLQRYAAVWTGDNLATWGHLSMANTQCQRLSISGLSFCGSDIGGFIGECNGELYVRWMQMAIFHPFFRTHSSGDHGEQNPWSYGEPYTTEVRKAIEMRYRFLPYIYTVFWQHVQTGTPMIRPLSFIDQEDPETRFRMDEFALGKSILVCPILSPGAKGREMYLPEGLWYNYFTDELVEGKNQIHVPATLGDFPLFIRAGSTIPNYPVMQYVNEKPLTSLDLHVYFDAGPYTSQIYEDAGDYYDYEQGNYKIRSMTIRGDQSRLRIQQRMTGRFNTAYSQFNFVIHGLPFIPAGMIVDGETRMFDTPLEQSGKVIRFSVSKNFEELSLMRLDGFA